MELVIQRRSLLFLLLMLRRALEQRALGFDSRRDLDVHEHDIDHRARGVAQRPEVSLGPEGPSDTRGGDRADVMAERWRDDRFAGKGAADQGKGTLAYKLFILQNGVSRWHRGLRNAPHSLERRVHGQHMAARIVEYGAERGRIEESARDQRAAVGVHDRRPLWIRHAISRRVAALSRPFDQCATS